MNKKKISLFTLAGLASALVLGGKVITSQTKASPQQQQPNIVYIMADDLGYGDLDATHMPRSYEILQNDGAQIDFHSLQNCAPTRAALMTGKDPSRLGMHGVDQIMFMQQEGFGVAEEEVLLSERLDDLGYATGIFGKWHLGIAEEQHPLNNGFDEYVGFLHGWIQSYGVKEDGTAYDDFTFGHDHHGKKENVNGVKTLTRNGHDLEANGVPLHSQTYSTFLFGNAAEAFIKNKASDDNPYFAYVPFNAPHTPYSAPRHYVDLYRDEFGITDDDFSILIEREDDVLSVPFLYDFPNTNEGNDQKKRLNDVLYYASVRAMDDAIGDLYQTVQETGEADNTIFMFLSDNGAGSTINVVGDNGHLRGGKGSAYEGSSRVANFTVWPGQVQGGGDIDDKVWIGDLYPTFIEAAGGEVPQGIDGRSALGVLQQSNDVNRNANGVWLRNGNSAEFVSHISKKMHRDTLNPDGSVATYTDVARIAFTNHNQKYIRTVNFQRLSVVDADGNETRPLVLDADGNPVADISEELYIIDDSKPLAGEDVNLVNEPAYANALQRMRTKFDRYGFDGATGDAYLAEMKTFYSNPTIPQEFYDLFVEPDEWTSYDGDGIYEGSVLHSNIF